MSGSTIGETRREAADLSDSYDEIGILGGRRLHALASRSSTTPWPPLCRHSPGRARARHSERSTYRPLGRTC